jgi:diguanylate cyclase (GGDEF)-like protein
MLKFYACVTQQHDLSMVALAALICAIGAYATFAMGVHARKIEQRALQRRWMLITVLTSASAIWATHFIAMLAFRVPMPSGFLTVPTMLSYIVALALVSIAGTIAIRSRNRKTAVIAGAILGFAISAMHYTGMSAFRVVGTISWDPLMVAVSVLIGLFFSILASLSVGGRKELRVFLPALYFLLAVCGDHFVAMSAATVTYDPEVALPSDLIDADGLLAAVAGITALILGSALTAYTMNVRARQRLVAERRRLEDFADFSVEGLLICDGTDVVWANRSIRKLLPDPEAVCVGRQLAELLTPESIHRLSQEREIDTMLGTGPDATPVRAIIKSIEVEGRPHMLVALRDQRERLRNEAEMRRLADTDPLTGLANRARFNDVLERMLASRRGDEREFALLSLDLDRFKHVNDAHGHGAGDALLCRVAGRLNSVVREGTLVARIGGDEFSIIAVRMDGPDSVRALADRIVEVMSRPFAIDGQVHEIGTSVGVAMAPSDGDTAEILIRNADLALYRAKEDGGNVYRMFEAGMDARMQARRGLELALRRAAARHEFELYYQPQVDAKTGAYTGAEALIRWIDPQRGIIPPSEFIPIAEETNLICGIGEWVIHTACAEAATWPAHLNVAVNLSPVQFREPRLLSIITSALEESGLPGHRLELEITESVLIDDEVGVLSLLKAFKKLGVRISLDDFGTGYSSLGHLSRFPFDKIKIDRSFVNRLSEDKDSEAIVRAIVSLGMSLGMSTTAEGVETVAQQRFVTDEGCDQIQGYLFSMPVPVCEMPLEFKPNNSKRLPWDSSGSSIAATAS